MLNGLPGPRSHFPVPNPVSLSPSLPSSPLRNPVPPSRLPNQAPFGPSQVAVAWGQVPPYPSSLSWKRKVSHVNKTLLNYFRTPRHRHHIHLFIHHNSPLAPLRRTILSLGSWIPPWSLSCCCDRCSRTPLAVTVVAAARTSSGSQGASTTSTPSTYF